MTTDTVAHVSGGSALMAATTAVTFGSPLVILGAPIWGLLAGIVGAACSYLPGHAVDERDVPLRLLGIFSDGLLGSWLAVFVVHLSVFEGSGIRQMPIEILCGGAAFGMQWLRAHTSPILQQLAGGLVSAITSTIVSWRRRPGGES